MDLPANYPAITEYTDLLMRWREPYDNHGPRVADYAVRLAAGAGLSVDEVNLLEVAAHLHDVGKLLMRYELLNQTRRLNASERAELQNHARLGHAFVSELGYHQLIRDVTLYHHEKWDGTGYPYGLKGDAIPRPARIISICDVYEAMTNHRPYREAYSHDVTLAYIKQASGKDFDPQLVELFLDMAGNS